MDISFKELVEIRKEEMRGMLPNMQTIVTDGDKSVVVKSPTAEEIVSKCSKG